MRPSLLATLLALLLPTSASASLVQRHAPPGRAPGEARIVNGGDASPGEYPAQGFLQIEKDSGTFACGGTLVGSRQFLTAAHCVTSGDTPLHPSALLVLLGDNNLAAPNEDVYEVARNDVNIGWKSSTNDNDTAMLTLSRPALQYEPMRVAGPRERSIWEPGDVMRIIGWGRTCSMVCDSSPLLEEANVPIVTDTFCASAYSNFKPSSMVCAADPVDTPEGEAHDTCEGDSGGPLLATDDDGFYATVGVVSFGNGCADPHFPGVYARIGAGALNTWVEERIPHAGFRIDHPALATQPVTLFSTSTHPEGDDYFTTFRWDFNFDGKFDDGVEGKSISVTFPSPGRRVVGLEASHPGGDRAVFYGAFDVAPAPTPPPPPPTASAAPAAAKSSTKLATFSGPKSLRAKNGRFKFKIRFAATAPRGQATLKVLFKTKVIGSAVVKIKPGRTVTAKFKLTKAGLKRLRKAGKLKCSLRLKLSGTTTRKKLTLRK